VDTPEALEAVGEPLGKRVPEALVVAGAVRIDVRVDRREHVLVPAMRRKKNLDARARCLTRFDEYEAVLV